MTPDTPNKYAELFTGETAVQRYLKKLSNRIDILREEFELNILSEYLKGSVFDCTIGVGRFINRLPHVNQYDGMDFSPEFVEYVKTIQPKSHVFTADLTRDIPLESASYDNTLCLRSLSGINNLAKILPEMVRVTKPGGLIIFDYGRKKTVIKVKGELMVLDGDDLESILKSLDAAVVRRCYLDALLTRVKIYDRVFRFLTGSYGFLVSDAALLKLEKWIVPLLWQRQIIILRRNLAA